MDFKQMVGGIGAGYYLIAGFGIRNVETSGSATRESVNW
jgi:hypothetical protein